MNKTIAVLSFISLTGYTIPDVSWTHTHMLTLPTELEGQVMPIEHRELIGPLPISDRLSQSLANQASNCVNLTHTDPHHTLNNGPYRPSFSQHFFAPDGAAVLFGWTFGRP